MTRTTVTIDGRETAVAAGESVWQAARRQGTTIPHLCLSTERDFRPEGNCRICMVEVEGRAMLAASCILAPVEGMVVRTDGKRVRRARRTVMELLLAEAKVHPASDAARWARELGVDASRFQRSRAPTPDRSHPGMAVDLGACIRCMRCVQACREVEAYDVIGMAGRGARTKIVFDFDDPMGRSTCVSCGACAQTCPTGAITFRPGE